MKHHLPLVAPAAGCLIALSVALSGCSGSQNEAKPTPTPTTQAPSTAANESPAASAGPSSDAAPSASADPAAQTEEAPVIGTKSLDIKGAPDGVKVQLLQPVVNGKTMTVDFKLSVDASAESSFNTTDLNKGQSNGDAGLNAWLIADNQRYLPGRLRGQNVQQGQSIVLSATFAAPKASKFTVHLDTVGDFENVSPK
jgi:hypothetical protein